MVLVSISSKKRTIEDLIGLKGMSEKGVARRNCFNCNKDEFSFRKAKRIKDEPEYEDAINRLYK